MKRLLLMLLLVAAMFTTSGAEPVAKEFLRYIYGAEGVELSAIMHPHDDVWMLRGSNDPGALGTVGGAPASGKTNGVVWALVGSGLNFFEIRDGKVDTTFQLEAVYSLQRQLIHRFLYEAFSQNRQTLARLVTDPAKVEITSPKPPPGEMGQYGEIISLIPLARASKPADDAGSKTITYRLPLGTPALELTLVKQGSTWKVDTSKGVRLSFEFLTF